LTSLTAKGFVSSPMGWNACCEVLKQGAQLLIYMISTLA